MTTLSFCCKFFIILVIGIFLEDGDIDFLFVTRENVWCWEILLSWSLDFSLMERGNGGDIILTPGVG